jgi:hypothetical protein
MSFPLLLLISLGQLFVCHDALNFSSLQRHQLLTSQEGHLQQAFTSNVGQVA